jgi:hypothetical protein
MVQRISSSRLIITAFPRRMTRSPLTVKFTTPPRSLALNEIM